MPISMWKAVAIEGYEREKSPTDCIENAILCEGYSEKLFFSSYDDAVFWLKKALDIRESLYGKNSIKNIIQYEHLSYIYAMKPSNANALKWYRKTIKIREAAVGKSDLSLVPNYISIAEVYDNMHNYDEYEKNIFHAKQIAEENNIADNSGIYYLYAALANYYFMRCYKGYKAGDPEPIRPEEDILLEKEALEKMVTSAVKEYGSESCEAIACLEKYIHDVKMPSQERLTIAGKILKLYFEKMDEFKKRVKIYDDISDFIEFTSKRIAADIWFSWSGDSWFPWDKTSGFDPDRSNIGWGIKWVKQNVSDEIAENLVLQFDLNDQKMIRDILVKKEMKTPVR